MVSKGGKYHFHTRKSSLHKQASNVSTSPVAPFTNMV